MTKKYLLSLIPIVSLLFSCTPKRGPKIHEVRNDEIDEFYEEPKIEDSRNVLMYVSDVRLDEYEIHSEIQYAYLNSGYKKVKEFADGTKELSKARTFNLLVENESEPVDEFYIQLSENEDFSDAILYQVEANNVDVTNLKIGTTYYYRGDHSASKLKEAQVFSFTTEETPIRNMNIDGVTNVRDIGGYESKLGGYVKQGLYYRGGRLNASNTANYKAQVTEEGYRQLIDELRLNTEIDLRMNPTHYSSSKQNEYGGMNNDAFPEIDYQPVPIDYDHSNMMKDEKEQIGKVFKILAKKSVYPVYLHCDIGTDRTGMCSYLLGTLLGIPQEDLFRDYLFSNFGNIGSSRDLSAITGKYLPYLQSYKEINLYLDVRDYLNDCGVSDDELDSIIETFLEV